MKTNNSFRIFSFIIFGLTFLAINSCKKANSTPPAANGPVITTNAVTNIGTKAATCGGNVSSDGGKTIIGKGVCWGKSQNPTAATGTYDGSGIGAFTSSITGLSSNTTYYVRAYAAVSGSEFYYGNQLTFKTLTQGTSSFSCSIDGAPYTATYIGTLSSLGKIGINGKVGLKSVVLWMPDPVITGTHSFSTFGDYMGQYIPDGSNNWTSDSGTFVISEYVAATGKIKGTFNFIASDGSTTINVTNGQFEVYM